MATGILTALNRLLYPQICPGCGGDLAGNEVVCVVCIENLPFTFFHLQAGNKAEQMFFGRVPVVSATSLLYFSKGTIVQNLIHDIKYNGQKELAVFLGELLGRSLKGSGRFDEIDVIIPLPLHPAKEKKRGYNQAVLLSEGVGSVIHRPVDKQHVVRLTHNPTQTRKHRQERWKNVEGIFGVINPELLRNRHILLVDDVITTGASLEACAIALLDNISSVKISIASLAIATH